MTSQEYIGTESAAHSRYEHVCMLIIPASTMFTFFEDTVIRWERCM
jgi:hypothetical protein